MSANLRQKKRERCGSPGIRSWLSGVAAFNQLDELRHGRRSDGVNGRIVESHAPVGRAPTVECEVGPDAFMTQVDIAHTSSCRSPSCCLLSLGQNPPRESIRTFAEARRYCIHDHVVVELRDDLALLFATRTWQSPAAARCRRAVLVPVLLRH